MAEKLHCTITGCPGLVGMLLITNCILIDWKRNIDNSNTGQTKLNLAASAGGKKMLI